MTNSVITFFLLSALLILNVSSSNSFMSNRVLKDVETISNKHESDEAQFGMLSLKSLLIHYKFSARQINEQSGESFYVVSNECLSKDSKESDFALSSCSIVSSFNSKDSSKIIQQDLVLNEKTDYEFNTNQVTLKMKAVESYVVNKENGNTVSEKTCYTDVIYSFVNAKAQKSFNYASDKIEDLAIQIKTIDGDCDAVKATPLLNLEAHIPADIKIYAYVAVMVLIGLIQAITCGVLVIQIDKNNNYAKQASMGTLCLLISFDFFIYLQHFTYWTAISNLMIIVFVLFFMLSVFFEPALLYFVFSTLQRRHNFSMHSLLFKLYFWLVLSGLGIMVAKTYLSEYILYTLPLCLIPQIFDSMYNRQKYKWNYALIGGLLLPKMAYMALLTFNPFNLFHTKSNPDILVFAATALSIQFIVLKVQTKYPGLGIIKKSTKNLFSYECQKDEIESVSAIICSICTEKVGMNPIIGQQPGQDQEEASSQPIMKTPCMHYYHESCLKEWFKKKFECPNCRQMLPPLENDDADE